MKICPRDSHGKTRPELVLDEIKLLNRLEAYLRTSYLAAYFS
jgi:hypothetical protein